jgi:hypothetical protein
MKKFFLTTVEDLQLLVKWVDLSGEHNTLEPYAYVDLKGRRASVGETAVANTPLIAEAVGADGSLLNKTSS